MTIINWNVNWNSGNKNKSLIINDLITSYIPDLVCLSESTNNFIIDKKISKSVIDHIFISKNLKINKINIINKIQNGITLSDHNGYFIEIENVV